MSVHSEIARLQAAKVDIMVALVEKGVDVTGKNLADVPGLIDSIVPPEEGLVIDGLKYRTVVLPDGREWMAENCQAVQGSATFYNDDEATYGRDGLNYGRLYTYNDAEAVANRVEGWRLPTSTECQTLISAVGGSSAYRKLASGSFDNGKWIGTDDYGFSMFAAGTYSGYPSDRFEHVGASAFMWCSPRHNVFRYVDSSLKIYNYNSNTTYAHLYKMSVRLIKDV